MELNQYIDSTLLKPEVTAEEIDRLCREAVEYRFAAVCANSCFAGRVKRLLEASGVETCVVVGFPLGTMATEAKAYEAKYAIDHGAGEIDMVMNVGALKGGDIPGVEADIRAVAEVCRGRALLKVILECSLLTDAEKVQACEAAVASGADFVKTSTGFGEGGATVSDVKLMKKAVRGRARVKASGGIRDLATAMAMIEAGAERLGTSSGALLVDESRGEGGLVS